MRLYRPSIWALAAVPWIALHSTEAAAQTIPSPYRFIETRQEGNAFAGVLSMGRGRFDFGPGPGPVFGGRYSIDLGGPFGLEALARFSPTTRRVIDPENSELREVGEAEALMTVVEGRVRFTLTGRRTWHGLAPHILFGGGLAFDLAGNQAEDERILVDDRFEFGTSFAGVLGAGLRWFPSERVTFRTDGTLNLWQLETPPGYSAPDRDFEAVEENEWVSGLGITLGVSIRF